MNTPANNSAAQIAYRAAKVAADAAEDAMMSADCSDAAAMQAAEAAFDAANIAEDKAGTEMIKWMRTMIVESDAPIEALVAVDAALAGDRRFRARILDLADAFAI